MRQKTGLLTLDALTLTVMTRLKIPNLASADQGFYGIEGTKLFSPEDIKGKLRQADSRWGFFSGLFYCLLDLPPHLSIGLALKTPFKRFERLGCTYLP